MNEKDLTGKTLERSIADAYRQMGATKVVHDVEIAGNQIDVYVELPTPGHSVHRVAVEAKDYTKPVGIQIVNDFAQIVNLLHGKHLVDEGVIVSSAGFSKQARNAAETHGIQLFEPADLEAMAGRAGVAGSAPSPGPATPVEATPPFPKETPSVDVQPAVPDAPPLDVVHELLMDAFTARDLRRLFLYAPSESPLHPLANRISSGDSLATMADEVIEYCDNQHIMDELLRAVKEDNPRQYARFEARLRGYDR